MPRKPGVVSSWDQLLGWWPAALVGVAFWAIVCVALAGVLSMGGCAFAPLEDGGLAGPFRFPGDNAGSPDGIGRAAGGILGALGVPGATLIGGGITALLAAVGYGAKKRGEDKGWDARESHQDRIDKEYLEGRSSGVPGAMPVVVSPAPAPVT